MRVSSFFLLYKVFMPLDNHYIIVAHFLSSDISISIHLGACENMWKVRTAQLRKRDIWRANLMLSICTYISELILCIMIAQFFLPVIAD